jgi:hemoglobin-like flavoprotein
VSLLLLLLLLLLSHSATLLLVILTPFFLRGSHTSLFVTCPEAKPLFGFAKNVPLAEIRESKRLLIHASFIVEMIEKALDMLGGDDKELTDFMTDLGKKHIAYGVKPEYMPLMQQSIVHMLKSMLNEKNGFTEKDEKAWQAVLSALVADMTRAQREVEMKAIADAMVI